VHEVEERDGGRGKESKESLYAKKKRGEEGGVQKESILGKTSRGLQHIVADYPVKWGRDIEKTSRVRAGSSRPYWGEGKMM